MKHSRPDYLVVLTYVALAAWATSLFLPVVITEGSPVGAVALVFYGMAAVLGWPHLPLMWTLAAGVGTIAYLTVPASYLLARRGGYRKAALLSALGSAGLLLLLVEGGLTFTIEARQAVAHPPTPRLALGLICWIVSVAMLTLVWTIRSRTKRSSERPPASVFADS